MTAAEQLKLEILKYPKSKIAAAYALGLKDKALELSPYIERLTGARPLAADLYREKVKGVKS